MAFVHCDCTSEHSREITRRKLLELSGKGVALGALGLSLPGLMHMQEAYGLTPENPFYDGVLCVTFNGGTGTIDSLDPKPGSNNNVFNTINLGANDVYNQPIVLSEVLPNLANLVQNDPAVGMGIVRSMWHGSNNHGNGQAMMAAFWRGQLLNSYPSQAPVFAHYLQGQGIGIPAVQINGNNLQGINDARGARVPTALQVDVGGNQNNNPIVQALGLPAGVDGARYTRRKDLIDKLNARFLGSRQVDTMAKAWEKATADAYNVTFQGDAARAFDLTGKTLLPAQNNQNAQRFTLAQELLKAGIPYVTCGIGGNDSHGNNMATVRNNWGQTFDRAVAAMAANLKATGKRYLIFTISDFARTPQTVAGGRDGRDHWGGAMSNLLISINQPLFKTTAIGDTGPDGLWVEGTTGNGGAGQLNMLRDPFEPAHLGYLVYSAMGIPMFAPDGRADVPTTTGRNAPPVDRTVTIEVPTGNQVVYMPGASYGTKLRTAFGLV